MKGLKAMSKPWSSQELETLEEMWGNFAVPTISKHLGRSPNAIITKARKIGLGAFLDNGDYVSFNQVLKCFGIENYSYTSVNWIKNKGFPVQYKKVNKSRFKVVKIENFWKWAKNNIDLIDFSRFQKNTLGEEPEWVNDIRKIHEDMASSFTRNTPWTPYEIERLKFLSKRGYTMFEISKDIRRTEGSIKRKMYDLYIETCSRSSKKKWSEKEKADLKQYILNDLPYEMISQKLGRSTVSIRSFLRYTYKTESLPKVKQKLAEWNQKNSRLS